MQEIHITGVRHRDKLCGCMQEGVITDIVKALPVHRGVCVKARTLIASRVRSGGVSTGCCPLRAAATLCGWWTKWCVSVMTSVQKFLLSGICPTHLFTLLELVSLRNQFLEGWCTCAIN